MGPRHYVQMAGDMFAVYDKAGRELRGPSLISTVWKGFGGPCESGDASALGVLYDQLADRWLLSHAVFEKQQQCVAVSKTGDPLTGGWHLYAFSTGSSNQIIDYPKLAMWPDGYYMGTYKFEEPGNAAPVPLVWVFEREAMLQGRSARDQHFAAPDHGYLLPADLNGPPPPTGTPGLFLRYVDGSQSGGNDRLELFAFHVNWSTPDRSRFEKIATLNTDAFDTKDCECVPQPGTSTLLQLLGDRLMWPLQYRNFGAYETLATNHTVNVGADGKFLAGIRWYELRRNQGGAWSIFQQGTHAPDRSLHRWMGSIGIDAAGGIALGYSVSSETVYPGIRYASRLRGDPPGQMTRGETKVLDGRGSQDGLTRWGGNSAMTVDDTEPCTFWYTTEYLPATGSFNWRTRIVSFRLPSCEPSK